MDELSKRCKMSAQHKNHYRNLFGFLCFTLLFGLVLRVQRRPGENFEMASVMLKILPEQPNGELSQPMESWEQVHEVRTNATRSQFILFCWWSVWLPCVPHLESCH